LKYAELKKIWCYKDWRQNFWKKTGLLLCELPATPGRYKWVCTL